MKKTTQHLIAEVWGRIDRVGKDGPRVGLFALEPTGSNLTFLYQFIKLLLIKGGAELEPEDDDVILRWRPRFQSLHQCQAQGCEWIDGHSYRL